ncbi:SusD family protein [compost metagenome]
MKINKILGFAGLSLALALGATSCKKSFLDTKPTDQAITQDVFKTVSGARSVINGMTRRLFDSDDHDQFSMPSINMTYDLMCEDMGLSAYGSNWFITSAVRWNDARGGSSYQWSIYYAVINNANFILQNIDAATGENEERNEVKAQAYAFRAWAYLQLIQCYQFPYNSIDGQYVVANGSSRTGAIGTATPAQALGVPIYTEPTKVGNPRASMKDVIDQINRDLDSSIANFEKPGTPARRDKSQININVAKGIYARAALYQQDWDKAATMAHDARQTWTLMSGAELLNGFNQVSNREWIWGLVINAEQNGVYASFMSHMDPDLKAYATGSQKIIGNSIFNGGGSIDTFLKRIPDTDIRRQWWLSNPSGVYARRTQKKFYANSKTSFVADYPMMRTAEMYLIEAEAIAQQGAAGNLNDAKTLLAEFVVTRDPSYVTTNLVTKNSVIQEIWRQRRIELWGEGFRYFDAKRQMAKFTGGVTSLAAINRGSSGFVASIIGSDNMVINATDVKINWRIPGSELNQNLGVYQNP